MPIRVLLNNSLRKGKIFLVGAGRLTLSLGSDTRACVSALPCVRDARIVSHFVSPSGGTTSGTRKVEAKWLVRRVAGRYVTS